MVHPKRQLRVSIPFSSGRPCGPEAPGWENLTEAEFQSPFRRGVLADRTTVSRSKGPCPWFQSPFRRGVLADPRLTDPRRKQWQWFQSPFRRGVLADDSNRFFQIGVDTLFQAPLRRGDLAPRFFVLVAASRPRCFNPLFVGASLRTKGGRNE